MLVVCWMSFPAGREGCTWAAPSPDPTMAGGRCTVQLFPALALPDQGVSTHHHQAWLQVNLRLRSAGPAGLRASPTYTSLCSF